MIVTQTDLPEVLILEPKVFTDERGAFFEAYNKSRLAAVGVPHEFVQDNQSMSAKRGTLRGLHFQKPLL